MQHDLKPCPLALTSGEWIGPIPHDYEAQPEWLADDAIVMVAFNPREHQVAMTWQFAEKRKAPAKDRDWSAVTAFCVECRPTPAGDAVERVARALCTYFDEDWASDGPSWMQAARAAIAAMGDVAGWRSIDTAPDMERIWVAGWQPASGSTQGYWWYHEGSAVKGQSLEPYENASMWAPLNLPPLPPTPETHHG